MPNKIISISDYKAKSSDIFFFDNNIWMFLYCPIGNFNRKKQAEYSKFFKYILSLRLHIFTNSLVLSEFSNRYLKLDFNIERMAAKNAGLMNDFKNDYLSSSHGKATIGVIKNHLNQITSLCQRCSDEFNSINLIDLYALFTQIGFNDSYYIQQASKKNWIIVSDDSDFTKNIIPDRNLTILTLL